MLTLRIKSVMYFTIGIALTIILVWSFAAWRADALPSANESTFVPITPVRVLDTRDPTNVGLPGPFVSAVSQDLQVTGVIATTAGNQQVVPPGATGIAVNLTVINASSNGFGSLRPADAVGPPTTSSINFLAGQIVANAVEVTVPTSGPDAGKIEITFDAYGTPGPTTDFIIDIVGYNTSQGLQELVAEVALKANAADVYTKAEVDAGFIAQGETVFNHATNQMTSNAGVPATVDNFSTGARVSGSGVAQIGLTGPARLGGVEYGLKSVEFCISNSTGGAFVDTVVIRAEFPTNATIATNGTNRSATGCYTVAVNDSGDQAYEIQFDMGGGGNLRFRGVESTWAPANTLAADASAIDTPPDPNDPTVG